MSFFGLDMSVKVRPVLPILALTILLAVSGALAHTHPEQMMPAPNATVEAPANITIHFNGALEPKFSKITVSGAAGPVSGKDPSSVSADGKTITLPLPKLAPGIYTVMWVGVSVDSHRAQGSYKFTVKE